MTHPFSGFNTNFSGFTCPDESVASIQFHEMLATPVRSCCSDYCIENAVRTVRETSSSPPLIEVAADSSAARANAL